MLHFIAAVLRRPTDFV